jgi:predicted glutamine amidotransferase
VAIVATEPLTPDEAWVKLAPGSLAVFQHGQLIL